MAPIRPSELRLVFHQPGADSQALVLEVFGQRRELMLPLAGGFQAMNALAALGLVIATGGSPTAAAEALTDLTAVPGRLQFIAEHRGGRAVVVDYAHTPDALMTVLTALRPHTNGRLVALFGCGGDRDSGKRPLMGGVATRLADRVYVTDDNPRTESAAVIRRAILDAAPNAIEIGDRRQAIATAIDELASGRSFGHCRERTRKRPNHRDRDLLIRRRRDRRELLGARRWSLARKAG